MARLFDDAQSEYLRVAGFAISEPFTLAAWMNCDDIGTWHQTIISVGDTDGTDHHTVALWESDNGGLCLRALSFDGSVHSAETTGITQGARHHVCGVFPASNSRSIYRDGANKVTDNTAAAVAGCDRQAIGVTADSTPSMYMSGAVAEAAIWDVALTDAEVAILAKGYSPLFVRPQNLVAYWSLIRDEDQDRVGGHDMTAYNTPSIAAHPSIIYPAPPYTAYVSAAAPPAAALPIFPPPDAIHSLVFGGVTVR